MQLQIKSEFIPTKWGVRCLVQDGFKLRSIGQTWRWRAIHKFFPTTKHHVLVPLLLNHGHMYKTMLPTLPPSQLTCSLSHNPRISRQSGWCCGWRTGPVIQCSPGCSPAESPPPNLRDRQREAMRVVGVVPHRKRKSVNGNATGNVLIICALSEQLLPIINTCTTHTTF